MEAGSPHQACWDFDLVPENCFLFTLVPANSFLCFMYCINELSLGQMPTTLIPNLK